MSARIDESRLDLDLLVRAISTLSETIVVMDVDRSILFVNRHDRLGFGPEGVLGSDALEYVSPQFRDKHEEQIREVVESGEADSDVVELIDAEGRSRWFRATATPLVADDEVVAVALAILEVTALQKARKEITMLKELLPVCAWCGKLRDEDDTWHSLESFAARSGARVTHGVCPDCAREMEE